MIFEHMYSVKKSQSQDKHFIILLDEVSVVARLIETEVIEYWGLQVGF